MKDSKECESCSKTKHIKSFRLTSSKSCKLCESNSEKPKLFKKKCLKCNKGFDGKKYNWICDQCKQSDVFVNDFTVYNFVR